MDSNHSASSGEMDSKDFLILLNSAFESSANWDRAKNAIASEEFAGANGWPDEERSDILFTKKESKNPV